MIRIIDTYPEIPALFDKGIFNCSKWEAYINAIYANCAHIFREDLDEYLGSGKYTFENDFLPILNAVYQNPKLDALHENFLAVTQDINRRTAEAFRKKLDVDIVLYLGLCNAAGWAVEINGSDAVMLGVEKILELNWHTLHGMRGLIFHELGHLYHRQHGRLEQESGSSERNFVWQLFTEGVAMYFEQALVGDFQYYHQDRDGWAGWCGEHFAQLLADFDRDLPAMTRMNQRYFGDWVDYHGHSDTGYYLGSRFVQRLLKETGNFDDLINLEIDAVYDLYQSFVRQHKVKV